MRGRIGIIGNMGWAAAVNLIGVDVATDFVRPTYRPQPAARSIYRGSHANRTTYFTEGLNGKRAVRLRQIVAGSLRVENGLVT